MPALWTLVLFLSASPLVGIEYFNNFYGRSGVCLALALDFRTACVVRFATKNIHRYDKNIKRNDTKFNTRNTNTEYSQPPTWSGVIWSARHTPERPYMCYLTLIVVLKLYFKIWGNHFLYTKGQEMMHNIINQYKSYSYICITNQIK
jgi:hypothetical protein